MCAIFFITKHFDLRRVIFLCCWLGRRREADIVQPIYSATHHWTNRLPCTHVSSGIFMFCARAKITCIYASPLPPIYDEWNTEWWQLELGQTNRYLNKRSHFDGQFRSSQRRTRKKWGLWEAQMGDENHAKYYSICVCDAGRWWWWRMLVFRCRRNICWLRQFPLRHANWINSEGLWRHSVRFTFEKPLIILRFRSILVPLIIAQWAVACHSAWHDPIKWRKKYVILLHS